MVTGNVIAELNRRFGIPGVADVSAGNGGMPKVRIAAPEAAGDVYLNGATVTSWKPAGQEEVLFVSAKTRWEDGKAIRGGVPICFPWFGNKADNPKAPAHGFVRAKLWQLESIKQSGGAVTVSLSTASGDDTKKWWPADFRLELRASFGKELRLELNMTNTGNTPLRFEEALHTYFSIGEIEKVRVRGLDGAAYIDKTDQNKVRTQSGEVAVAKETDSVYQNACGAVELADSVLRRRIRITKENSLNTVVWNPWAQKAEAMADLGGEWKKMICVECCNTGDSSVGLAPGQQHSMKAILSVAG